MEVLVENIHGCTYVCTFLTDSLNFIPLQADSTASVVVKICQKKGFQLQVWIEKINLCPSSRWCYFVQSVWPTIRCSQIFTAPHSFQLPRLGLASTPFLSLQCEPGMLNPCLFIDLYMYRYVHIDIDHMCIYILYIYIYICIFKVTGSQFPKSEMQHNNSGLKNLSGMIFYHWKPPWRPGKWGDSAHQLAGKGFRTLRFSFTALVCETKLHIPKVGQWKSVVCFKFQASFWLQKLQMDSVIISSIIISDFGGLRIMPKQLLSTARNYLILS